MVFPSLYNCSRIIFLKLKSISDEFQEVYSSLETKACVILNIRGVGKIFVTSVKIKVVDFLLSLPRICFQITYNI